MAAMPTGCSVVQPPLHPRGSRRRGQEPAHLPLRRGSLRQPGGRGGSRGAEDLLQVAFFLTDGTERAREALGFVTAAGPGTCLAAASLRLSEGKGAHAASPERCCRLHRLRCLQGRGRHRFVSAIEK